jgi:hypothetical protein
MIGFHYTCHAVDTANDRAIEEIRSQYFCIGPPILSIRAAYQETYGVARDGVSEGLPVTRDTRSLRPGATRTAVAAFQDAAGRGGMVARRQLAALPGRR